MNGTAGAVPAVGLRADRAGDRRSDDPGGRGRRPVQDDPGVHRRGEGLPRPDELFVLGHLRHAARGDGDVRQCRRHQDVPRPLPGRRPGGDRAARRPGARARLGAGGGRRPDQGRQDARARRLGRQAPADDARAAHLQGARLQGRRVLHLVGRVRARRDARAGAGAAARGGARRGRRSRSSAARWRRSQTPISYLDAPRVPRIPRRRRGAAQGRRGEDRPRGRQRK